MPVLVIKGVQLPKSTMLLLSVVCVPINPVIVMLVLTSRVMFVTNVTEIILSLQGYGELCPIQPSVNELLAKEPTLNTADKLVTSLDGVL